MQSQTSRYISAIACGGLLILAGSTASLAQDLDYKTIGLDRAAYGRLLSQQFTRIISPQSANSIGNFAAYNSANGQITFAGATVLGPRSAAVVTVNGAGSGGLLPFIANGDPVKASGAEVQVHVMPSGSSRVTYPAASCAAFRRDSARARYRHAREEARIKAGGDLIAARFRLDSMRTVLVVRQLELGISVAQRNAAIAAHARAPSAETSAAKIQSQSDADTVTVALALTRQDLVVALRDSATNAIFALARIGDERAIELKKAAEQLTASTFSIGWISFGYDIEGTTFTRLDTTAAFAAQLQSTTNLAQTVRVQYARYSTPIRGGAAQYWTVGASVAATDDFVKLKKIDVTDIRQLGAASGTREARSTAPAYLGAYEQGLASASFFADYYRFITKQNTPAVHVYPAVDVQRGSRGITKLGVGLLTVFSETAAEPTAAGDARVCNFNRRFCAISFQH